MPLPLPDDAMPAGGGSIDEMLAMIDEVLAGQPADLTEDLDEDEIRRLITEQAGANADLVDLSKPVPTVLGNTRGPWDEMPPSENR